MDPILFSLCFTFYTFNFPSIDDATPTSNPRVRIEILVSHIGDKLPKAHTVVEPARLFFSRMNLGQVKPELWQSVQSSESK